MTTETTTAPHAVTVALTRLAAAGREWFTAAAVAFDRYDRTFFAGLAMLIAGLWIWVGLGKALTVAGAVVIVLGVAAARAAVVVDELAEQQLAERERR